MGLAGFPDTHSIFGFKTLQGCASERLQALEGCQRHLQVHDLLTLQQRRDATPRQGSSPVKSICPCFHA